MISIVWGGRDFPVTQPYGQAHRGIDIGCPMFTPLFAARSGVVTVAADWGVAIAVDGTNQTDWYLHTSSANTQHGWRAERGTQVALSGMTQVPGGPPPTGPHLHFEVQTGALDVWATSLNPVPVLTGLYGGGGGELNDMTPEESQKLSFIYNAIVEGTEDNPNGVAARIHFLFNDVIGGVEDNAKGVTATVHRIETAVKALPANTTAVDLKPVLDAIAALKFPTTITGKLT